ncbi:MAG: peptide ABC transporter substrate-binding protein [Candidatus Saccharibacteria bacterium]|nr:peptide ABC transporter substrate-binding protein [Candidatus Saccharibacteria bacterium]
MPLQRPPLPSADRLKRPLLSKKLLGKRVKKIEKRTLRHARRFVVARLSRLAEVRRHVIGWLALVMLLVGLSAAQWWSFHTSVTHQAYEAGGAYSEGVLGPLETVNPLFARSSAERSAARLLFASLYQYDDTGHIHGDLAERVVINSAETEYTVTLKPQLRWSDGRPITAADVVFTVGLLQNPEARTEIAGWQTIRAQAVDERTVKFHLPASYAPFMHALTFPVLPRHHLAQVKPSELREHASSSMAVSSGPFTLRRVQNVTIDGSKKIAHLSANPHYHRAPLKLERFQLYVYSTKDEIVKGLKTNEIMATPELAYADVPEETRRSYRVTTHTLNDGVYALFNMQSQSIKSLKVRQALALSVDRQKLREQLSSEVRPLDGPVLASSVEAALPPGVAHDENKARTLLDEEGWRLHDGQRKREQRVLTIDMVVLRGGSQEKAAQFLAETWRRTLAITVEVKVIDPADATQNVLQTVLRPRNFDVLVYELVLGGDPDVFAYWHSSQATQAGLNFANYNNVVADDALASGRAKLSAKQRADRYAAFVKRWQADVPAVALYRPTVEYIKSPTVRSLHERTELVYAADRYYTIADWAVRQNTVYKTP